MLEIRTALIGTPEKGDAVIIGLEDGRSLSLTYGTTIASNKWQITPLDSLPEVDRVLMPLKDDPVSVAGDPSCTIDTFETIAVGKYLRIVVTSQMEMSAESKNTWTNLSSAVATITIV